MIHECKIHCHTIDPSQVELMGIEDQGKWLPFAFHLDMVVAVKMTSDEEDLPYYRCTTVFTDTGDTYIINTPFSKFSKIWINYMNIVEEEENDQDIIL